MKAKISLLLAGLILLSTLSIPIIGSANTRTGSISGTVTYSGIHDTDHEVSVAAHPSLQHEPVDSVHIQGPGNYSIDGLPDGDYYISAFLDIHDKHSGPPYSGEPLGWYDSNNDGNPDPVTITGNNLSGIDILMKDIESNYIQGTACYLGGIFSPTGRLEVGLQTTIGQEPMVHQFISLPCEEFAFSNIPPGSYYVYLFYDLNSSGNAPEPGEPLGYYDSNGDGVPDPVVFKDGDSITGINITLSHVHHVDFSATGDGNGSSWEDAFTDLQDALAIAEPGEEIWVAAGVYTPGTNRSDTFELQQGVAIYGGFNGTEEHRYQRNWGANTSVLSGEIGDQHSGTDNIYHVISSSGTIDKETILDGFTISGGYASEEAGGKGGGLNNTAGFPTLANLNFIGNYALDSGAAIATNGNTQPLTITNCTFSGNNSNANGAIFNYQGKIAVYNSSIVGNSGSNGGGIVTVGKYSDPPDPFAVITEVHNTILWDNPGGPLDVQVITGTTYATLEVSYSLIQGGFAEGIEIVTDDPLFVNAKGADNQYGTWDDDLHLQAASPAINAGNNTLIPPDSADSDGDGDLTEAIPLDFDRGIRIVNAQVDIGADEYDAPQAITGLQIATSQPARSGQTTIFAARAENGTHISYTWDFGDGSVGTGPVIMHVYSAPGIYQVTLTAENNLGDQQTTLGFEVSQSLVVDPGQSQKTDDGILSIERADSIPGAVTFVYTPQSEPSHAPGSLAFAGISFKLAAIDAESNPIIEPSEPFILTLYYDEGSLPDGVVEEVLQIYRYDSELEDWVALDVLSRNLDEDQLIVQLDHFSEFGLFTPTSPLNLYLPLILR
jgi:hypothetical protein